MRLGKTGGSSHLGLTFTTAHYYSRFSHIQQNRVLFVSCPTHLRPFVAERRRRRQRRRRRASVGVRVCVHSSPSLGWPSAAGAWNPTERLTARHFVATAVLHRLEKCLDPLHVDRSERLNSCVHLHVLHYRRSPLVLLHLLDGNRGPDHDGDWLALWNERKPHMRSPRARNAHTVLSHPAEARRQ